MLSWFRASASAALSSAPETGRVFPLVAPAAGLNSRRPAQSQMCTPVFPLASAGSGLQALYPEARISEGDKGLIPNPQLLSFSKRTPRKLWSGQLSCLVVLSRTSALYRPKGLSDCELWGAGT